MRVKLKTNRHGSITDIIWDQADEREVPHNTFTTVQKRIEAMYQNMGKSALDIAQVIPTDTEREIVSNLPRSVVVAIISRSGSHHWKQYPGLYNLLSGYVETIWSVTH